jgi:hypothetical protein
VLGPVCWDAGPGCGTGSRDVGGMPGWRDGSGRWTLRRRGAEAAGRSRRVPLGLSGWVAVVLLAGGVLWGTGVTGRRSARLLSFCHVLRHRFVDLGQLETVTHVRAVHKIAIGETERASKCGGVGEFWFGGAGIGRLLWLGWSAGAGAGAGDRSRSRGPEPEPGTGAGDRGWRCGGVQPSSSTADGCGRRGETVGPVCFTRPRPRGWGRSVAQADHDGESSVGVRACGARGDAECAGAALQDESWKCAGGSRRGARRQVVTGRCRPRSCRMRRPS